MSQAPLPPDKTAWPDSPDDVFGPDFKPLSAEQARQWRQGRVTLTPWRIVAWQVAVAVGLVLVALVGWPVLAGSVAYGAVASVVPAALMAHGLSRRRAQGAATLAGFFVWELAKVALTVALLLMAPRWVPGLSWLALLAGFVVTMKVYWLAMWLQPARRKSAGNDLN